MYSWQHTYSTELLPGSLVQQHYTDTLANCLERPVPLAAMLGQQKLRTDHVDVSASDAAEAHPVVDVQDVPSMSCRICMSDYLQHPAKIQTCGHRFW